MITKYKINNDVYEVIEIEDNKFYYGYRYEIYKNGELFRATNGSTYETSNEAELNILLEYLCD